MQGGVYKEAGIGDYCEGDDLVLIRVEGNVVIDKQDRVFQAKEVGQSHAAKIGHACPQCEAERNRGKIAVAHGSVRCW
jgi:hypothetical protein